MDTSVTVQEVMDRTFVGVTESDALSETVELMVEDGAESVVVLRGQDPVGILTQRDVLEQFVSGGIESATVADAMTEAVPTVDPGLTLSEAASELSTRATQRLVVTDGSEPIGVLSEHDLMSTSPFTRERVGDVADESPVPTTPGAGSDDAVPADSYQDQSICEACGSFARDLTAVNGQILCADCRDI